MPVIQNNQSVWLYKDAVEQVLDAFDIDRDGLNQRRARASVLQAYRDMPQRHDWSYLIRQRLMQTVAPQSSSTITYDHTGGAYERVLTIAAGTWPSWAAYGRVIIDDVHYDVEDRKSSTQLTLSDVSNPGADVDAGTAYQIYRSAYPLPANFKRLLNLWDNDQERQITFVDTNQQHLALQIFYESPSTPWQATIRASGKYLGGRELVFGPPPSSIRTYDMLYEVTPRPLAIEDYSTGTVTCAASTSVTGTSTTFPTNCVGSVIRFAASGTSKPSSHIGSLDGVDNPYVAQGVIKERTSATALVLEEALSVSVSGVGYVISDPIEIDASIMWTALIRAAEAEFARLKGMKDYGQREQSARIALLQAMESDSSYSVSPKRVVYNPYKYTELTSE